MSTTNRRAHLQGTGIILIGLAGLLAASWLPLRVTIGLVLPWLAGLLIIRRAAHIRQFTWVIAGWMGLILLIVAAEARMPFYLPAWSITGLGLLLFFAAGAGSRRTCEFDGTLVAMGIRIGFLLALPFVGFLCAIGAIRVNSHNIIVVLLILLSAPISLLAARQSFAAGLIHIHRRYLLIALALPLLMLTVLTGFWFATRWQASHAQRLGASADALRWNEQEIAFAEQLNVTSWRVQARLRQVLIYGPMSPTGYLILKSIAELDPANKYINRLLLSGGIAFGDQPEIVLHWFNRLPDNLVEAKYARALLKASAAHNDWSSFFRAWRLANLDDPAAKLPDDIDWTRVMLVAFHRDDYMIVEKIGAHLQETGSFAWSARRILAMTAVRKNTPTILDTLLDTATQTDHPEEVEFIRAAATTTTPTGIVFDHKLALTAGSIAPLTNAIPGGTLDVTLKWQILTPVDPSWKVVIHLRQTLYDGFFFQGDYRFVDVTSSNMWRLGQQIEQHRTISIPTNAPTGEYRVTLGLWNSRTMFSPQASSNLPGMRIIDTHRARFDSPIAIR